MTVRKFSLFNPLPQWISSTPMDSTPSSLRLSSENAGTVPAALTVGGNGTKGTASLVITGGELYLSVAPGLPEAGTNLLFTVTDSQLNLSWPSNYTGWLLQSNSVSLADSNGWFTVPGSTAANHAQIRFAPGNASVFYRLAHP